VATAIGQRATEVAQMNPWWRSPATWQNLDQDLSEVAASGLGYRADALDGLHKGGLYLLRGPRRVGKTVAVKQSIAALLAVGVPPLSIVRLAVDAWTATDLRTVVQNIPLPPLPEGHQRWWFIDEVTAVTGDWATQVKWLRDNVSEFAAATVVLTGSSSSALTASAGVLAGRRGKVANTDRTLMPMGFRSFAGIFLPDVNQLPRLRLDEVHSPTGAAAYAEAQLWLADLVRLWEVYLQYGGYPTSVAAAHANQPIPTWFVDSLFSVVHRDAFGSSSLDESQTTALTGRLWESTSTPLNLHKVGQEVGLNHVTVSRHVNYLRDAYLLWACPQLKHPWVPNDHAQDKVYPVDPVIGRLAHLRTASRPDLDPTALAESQIGMAMRRAEMSAGGQWTADESLLYLRTPARNEVDFVAEALSGAAVEGKYTQTGAWQREAATVSSAGYRGVLTTRNVLDTKAGSDGPWAVPAGCLAALLDT